jgi:signal transduction histidine kinase
LARRFRRRIRAGGGAFVGRRASARLAVMVMQAVLDGGRDARSERVPTLADALVALLLVVVFWVPSLVERRDWLASVLGFSLALVTAAAVVLRRRHPAAATAAAGLATLVGTAFGLCQDPMLATAVCLYPLAISRSSDQGTVLVIAAAVVAGLAVVTAVPGADAGGVGQRLVVAIGALSGTWLLGTSVGKQLRATREAERARVQLGVAREVHDTVGHALGLISATAGVAHGLPDTSEQELRGSLAEVKSHARRALEELQMLVRALRDDPAKPEPARPLGAPATGELPALIATVEAAGVPVAARCELSGRVDDLIGTMVFRIVQESLSNVVRHAAGSPCAVDVYEEGDGVVVRVRDQGPGGDGAAGSGFGLRGMQERAHQVGGRVRWRNHPDGGFEVEAWLPAGGRP